ncbi:MAG: ferritin [Thiobacillus sp.]|nr:ferritin [Thiobacillus sp.]
MSVDPRTLGWLARALTHEMSAVQQYLAQSVLARLWGDDRLAAELRHEAIEELGHAERLMESLIKLGVAPSAGNLPPSRLGRTADALLAADHQLEVDAVRLYQQALAHAERMRDGECAQLFASILREEMEHVNALATLGGGERHG